MIATIAVLGTGTMGDPMARNLLRAGFEVRVWNRTPAKAAELGAAGALATATPGDAVRGADAVITMLYDGATVAAIMRAAAPDLRPGALWLQMSTIGPAAAAALVPLAEELGVSLVDAPVVGTRAPAQAGTLTILANGADAVRGECGPIFSALATRTVWVDGPQSAQRLKLVANNWVLALTEALAETLRFARGLDLDPAVFLDAIAGTANDVRYAQIKGEGMLAGDFTPSFSVDNARKDAHLVLAAARQAGVDLAIVRIALAHLDAAGRERGGDDISALILALDGSEKAL